jgi:hypothetical protein
MPSPLLRLRLCLLSPVSTRSHICDLPPLQHFSIAMAWESRTLVERMGQPKSSFTPKIALCFLSFAVSYEGATHQLLSTSPSASPSASARQLQRINSLYQQACLGPFSTLVFSTLAELVFIGPTRLWPDCTTPYKYLPYVHERAL